MFRQASLVLLAVLTVTVAGAQTGRIRISGTAELLVPPDVAQVVFSVTSEDPDRAAAEQKAASEVKAILDEIAALELPKLQTRTPPGQTNKQEAWPPQRSGAGVVGGVGYTGTPRKAGYVVGTAIEVWFEGDAVTLEAGVNKIMAIAQAHGGTNITPDIACRDLEPAKRQALADATRMAIKRAQAMAKAAGVRIKGYSYIGPCPENSRDCPLTPVAHRGSGRFHGMGAGGGQPVLEVHGTMVQAIVWVTALY